jgi:hypothetical protein
MIIPLSTAKLDVLGLKNPGVGTLSVGVEMIDPSLTLLVDNGLDRDGLLSHLQHLVIVKKGTNPRKLFGVVILGGRPDCVVGRVYTKHATVLDSQSNRKRDALARLLQSAGRKVSLHRTL